MKNWLPKLLSGNEEAPISKPDERDSKIDELTKKGLELQEAVRLLLADKTSRDYKTGYSDGLDCQNARLEILKKENRELNKWRTKIITMDFET